MNLKLVGKTALKFADKHLPEILSMLALLGLGGAIVSATNQAPQAVEALDEAKSEKLMKLQKEDEEAYNRYLDDVGNIDYSKVKLTPWEWFKAEAPIYWFTWVVGASTALCIILSNRIGARRYAALLAALSLNEKKLKEYKEKAQEIFGAKKVKQLEEEIIKDEVMDMPAEVKEKIDMTCPTNKYPCLIRCCSTWFYGNTVSIERAFVHFNDNYLMRNGEATLTELLYSIDEFNNIMDENFKYDTWLNKQAIWEYDNTHDSLLHPIINYGSTVEGVPCIIVDLSRPADTQM